MGLIKEPKGVDLVIKSRPLTAKEEADLSKYIRDLKEKRKKKLKSRRRPTKTKSE